MYNRIILIGRPTRDPELRFTAEGHAVATFTLAVDRPFKNGQGEREANFIDVTVWRKPAESTAQYVHKGHLIAVEGRLDIRSYTDRQGIRRKWRQGLWRAGCGSSPRNRGMGSGMASRALPEMRPRVASPGSRW